MCAIIQWLPSYCLHVKRVERLCYVHNIDTFNAMSKGSKEYVMYTIKIHLMLCRKSQKIMLCTEYRCIQCYVKRVERVCYVHNIDIFNAMLKESKDYVIYTI